MANENQKRHLRGAPASMGGKYAPENKEDSGRSIGHVSSVKPVFAGLKGSERTEAMKKALEAALKGSATDPKKLVELMEFKSRFRRYSMNNTMLIHIQHPGATHVAGKTAWADAGGRIKKGAKAIWIYAPMKVRVSEDEDEDVKEKVFFRPVPVYDISDIEGVDAPESFSYDGEDAPEGMVESITGAIEKRGFNVGYVEGLPDGSEGVTTPGGMVLIKRSTSRREAMVLAHELGHIECGHLDRFDEYKESHGARGAMEAEAETVAFMLGTEWGLTDAQNDSANYIKGWNNNDVEKSMAGISHSLKAASTILEEIHPAWKPPVDPEAKAAREEQQKSRKPRRGKRK